MKKKEKIHQLIHQLAPQNSTLDPRFSGFFELFNQTRYYEAHDLLEDFWLLHREDADATFYQALIQLAGAFVHLQKQFQNPDHRVDGKRIPPALRLLVLAEKNLTPFSPVHNHLRVDQVCDLCKKWNLQIAGSDCKFNPWNPDSKPEIPGNWLQSS